MSGVRLSVALCTFNGAAFLQEQLDSIAAQSRLPDEIIICDDGSTDATAGIIENFRDEAGVPVQAHLQGFNQGVVRNFERAVSLCSGELIALCDQDDVWHTDKLARMETALDHHPEWGLAFHNLALVDADLNPLGATLWQSIGFGQVEQEAVMADRSWEVLLRRTFATGAGTVFRSKYRKALLPFEDCWVHDGWIAMILAGISSLGCVPDLLAQYRQHEANVVGGRRKTVLQYVRETASLDPTAYLTRELARIDTVVERMRSMPSVNQQFLKHLGAKRRFLESRARYPANRIARVPRILGNWMNYKRYGRGIGVGMRDLLLSAR